MTEKENDTPLIHLVTSAPSTLACCEAPSTAPMISPTGRALSRPWSPGGRGYYDDNRRVRYIEGVPVTTRMRKQNAPNRANES